MPSVPVISAASDVVVYRDGGAEASPSTMSSASRARRSSAGRSFSRRLNQRSRQRTPPPQPQAAAAGLVAIGNDE